MNLKITENPKAEDAIQAMKKAGAVTSLAHFHKKIGFKNYTREEQEANIKYLHEIGLVWYGSILSKLLVKMMKI